MSEQLKDYQYIVTVSALSEQEASQIMIERIGYDEDLSEYGIGDYRISFEERDEVQS